MNRWEKVIGVVAAGSVAVFGVAAFAAATAPARPPALDLPVLSGEDALVADFIGECDVDHRYPIGNNVCGQMHDRILTQCALPAYGFLTEQQCVAAITHRERPAPQYR